MSDNSCSANKLQWDTLAKLLGSTDAIQNDQIRIKLWDGSFWYVKLMAGDNGVYLETSGKCD